MGPFTQMDKSTIQGLSFEEYTPLSRYYPHVITPILLRELSSMLAKKEEDLDDLKKKVSLLAAKSTFGSVHLIPSAEKLAYSNLMGEFVPMNGRLPIEGGTFCVTEDGSKGWVLDEPAEVTLLKINGVVNGVGPALGISYKWGRACIRHKGPVNGVGPALGISYESGWACIISYKMISPFIKQKI